MSENKAVFTNGVLTAVYPGGKRAVLENRGIALDPDCIYECDGISCGPCSIEQLKAIPVPAFKQREIIAVLDLSYIMKMRCGKNEDADLLEAYVDKTLALMMASPISWSRGDYLQVIRNYYRLGMLDDGNAYELAFRRQHPNLFSSSLDASAEGEHLTAKYYFEDKIHRYAEYEKVVSLVPKMAPKTVKGYLQIKTRKTDKYLAIREACEKQGFIFDDQSPYHYCNKLKCVPTISETYSKLAPEERYVTLMSCLCDKYLNGECDGKNEYGLKCNYNKN